MVVQNFFGMHACAALILLCCSTSAAAADAALSSEQHTQQTAASTPKAERAHGRLYRVQRGAQRGYLFGTVHVGKPSLFPLSLEVSRALSEADELVVELDTRTNAGFDSAALAHGSYRGADTIAQHVSPATLAQLRSVLHGAGISVRSVGHMKPWLLANLLLGLELQRHGYDRSHGVEAYLLSSAARQGARITELESADYQLALFDTLTDAESERYLVDTLDGLTDGSALRKARTVLRAWRFGGAATLDEVMADATADDSVGARFTRTTLLGKRNPDMVASIETIMNGGRTAFVGVGLLHLLGANGLPELLMQRGFQVERVY